MPVVVGLDHHQVDVAVRTLVEDLAGEAGEVGEVQAGQLAAGVHVADSLIDVEAARAHLVVAGCVDVVHLAGFSCDGVQAHVPPADLAVVPLLDTVGLDDHPGGAVFVFRGDVRVEHVRRLGDMVVHADQDQIVLVHAALPLFKGLVDNDLSHRVNGPPRDSNCTFVSAFRGLAQKIAGLLVRFYAMVIAAKPSRTRSGRTPP